MDIRIGIINAPREVAFELADDVSLDELKADIQAGAKSGDLVWVTDKKGRQVGFPGAQVAFVELGVPGDEQRIGFS